MLKEDIDYKFVDIDNDMLEEKITGVGLLMPEYEGVLYHYHKAKVVEEGELARLQFGYTILESGEHDVDALTKDEKLHTIMGDILTDIILNKKQLHEPTRTDYPEEFDSQ